MYRLLFQNTETSAPPPGGFRPGGAGATGVVNVDGSSSSDESVVVVSLHTVR